MCGFEVINCVVLKLKRERARGRVGFTLPVTAIRHTVSDGNQAKLLGSSAEPSRRHAPRSNPRANSAFCCKCFGRKWLENRQGFWFAAILDRECEVQQIGAQEDAILAGGCFRGNRSRPINSPSTARPPPPRRAVSDRLQTSPAVLAGPSGRAV